MHLLIHREGLPYKYLYKMNVTGENAKWVRASPLP